MWACGANEERNGELVERLRKALRAKGDEDGHGNAIGSWWEVEEAVIHQRHSSMA